MPRRFYFGLALQLLINLAFVLDELCISSSHELELAMCIRCFEHIALSSINRSGEFQKDLQTYLDFHPTY